MKITMVAEITGLRDGKPWPARGESITVPDDEAEVMIANNLAKKYEKADESVAAEAPAGASTEPLEVSAPPAPETATTAPPAKKAAAKKAAKKAPGA